MKSLPISSVILCFLFSTNLLGQLTVVPNTNADQIVQTVVGNGAIVVPASSSINCGGAASAIFDGSTSNVGMASGVLLTTGDASQYASGNDELFASYGDGTAFNDPDLLTFNPGMDMFDGCIVEFDIIPICDTLKIDYVFASEEYPDFVCSTFNDAFGFFISGPNINGPFANNAENIALIPNTTDYVAINSVNNGVVGMSGMQGGCGPTGQNNTQYFVDNDGGTTVEFNGFTVPLTAVSAVNPCEVYHMKLVIADVGDNAYDSGVFLAEAGLTCPANTVEWTATIDNTLEGCSPATFTLDREGDLTTDLDVIFSFLGTATNGSDYNFQSTHNFPVGVTTVDFTLDGIDDNMVEGLETIQIIASVDICGNLVSDTLDLTIIDEPFADAGADQSSCDVNFTLLATDPAPYTGNWTGPAEVTFADSTNPNTVATVSTPGDYELIWTVTAIAGCSISDTAMIATGSSMTLDFNIIEPLCYGDPASIGINGALPGGTYDWIFSGVYTGTASGEGVHDIAYTSDGSVTIVVHGDLAGCIADTTLTIDVLPLISLQTAGFNASCSGSCNGLANVIPSGGTGTYTYLWAETNQTVPSILNLCEGIYTITVTDENSCNAQTTVELTDPTPISATFVIDDSECGQPTGSASVTASGGTAGVDYSYSWSVMGNEISSTNSITNIIGPISVDVLITDDNFCTYDTLIIVPDSPGFELQVDYTTNVSCFGECDGTASVTAIGDGDRYDFTWTSPAGFNQTGLIMTNLCEGTYTIDAVDTDTDCASQIQLTITEPEELTIQAYSDTTICIQGTASLSSQAFGGTEPYVYGWTYNGNIVPGQNISDSPDLATVYSVIVTDNNDCVSDLAVVYVSLYDSLQVTLTASDSLVCPGECVDLVSTGLGGIGAPYTFSFNGNSSNNNTINYCPQGSEVVTVVLSDACETPNVQTDINLDVHAIPSPSIIGPNNSCIPFSTCLSFDDETGISNASWVIPDIIPVISIPNTLNPCFSINTSGFYDVQAVFVTDEGCSDSVSSSDYIEVYPNPIADFEITPDTISSVYNEFEVIDNSSGADIWTWYVDSIISENGQYPILNLNDPGTHLIELIVETNYGCADTAKQPLVVLEDLTIYVPNCFTPNGDGSNDSFFAKGVGIKDGTFEMLIYDRWGNLIFTGTDINEVWDGIIRECWTCGPESERTVAQIDVYVWKIKVDDLFDKTHKFIGHVSLVR